MCCLWLMASFLVAMKPSAVPLQAPFLASWALMQWCILIACIPTAIHVCCMYLHTANPAELHLQRLCLDPTLTSHTLL